MLGDDDLSYAQFVDITSGHGTFTGVLHYGSIKNTMNFYQSSGTVTHDYGNSSFIWINKTGGGNFTLNLNNVPADGANRMECKMIIKNQGGSGYPTGLNINGVGVDLSLIHI